MKENWKDVLEYEGLYQASDLGRIRSLNYNRTGEVRILKPQKESCGYLQVGLSKEGERNFYMVHRLIYEAFKGRIPEGFEINHIDENKENNNLNNLNLMTRTENNNYGTRTKRVVEKLSMCVLQFTLDWKFIREWPSAKECGRNGFDSSGVSKCCRGIEKYKSHKGYRWMYAEDFFRMLPEI